MFPAAQEAWHRFEERLESDFSSPYRPGMGAQCCKGDQYMNQVETVKPSAAKVRNIPFWPFAPLPLPLVVAQRRLSQHKVSN